MTRIFISHSHSDEAIAYKLVNFLLAALRLEEEEILCTSNSDQGLDFRFTGITDQLKEHLKNSEALIILITADSLHSAWIPFEVGSFWTTDKLIIPILGPGLTHDDLPGPLRSLLSISIEAKDWSDKVNNAINQLVEQLKSQQKVTKRRNDTLEEFSDALRAWQSQRPAPDVSQQKQIEELTKKLEDKERNYQNQKQKLEQSLQSLQSEIKQLKQELEKERSQVEQLQLSERSHKQQLEEKERSLQVKIEQLEQELSEARSPIEGAQKDVKTFSFEVLTVNERGEEVKREKSQAQYFMEELGNGVTLDMIAIPGGKFLMGTEDQEIERLCKKYKKDYFKWEKPQHEVTVQPFFMGKYPVTQAQYQQVMSKNPSNFKGGNRPVEQVSWDDAVEFCQRLSKETGREYRLPSEAEWEYACRAGTKTPFHFGQTMTDKLANYNASETYASESQGEYRKETMTVGIFTPNAFGLYDMHGQVREWCADDWHENYGGMPIDGRAWVSGVSSIKVLRGGSWVIDPWGCRSAFRYRLNPVNAVSFNGFRVACGGART